MGCPACDVIKQGVKGVKVPPHAKWCFRKARGMKSIPKVEESYITDPTYCQNCHNSLSPEERRNGMCSNCRKAWK